MIQPSVGMVLPEGAILVHYDNPLSISKLFSFLLTRDVVDCRRLELCRLSRHFLCIGRSMERGVPSLDVGGDLARECVQRPRLCAMARVEKASWSKVRKHQQAARRFGVRRGRKADESNAEGSCPI